MSPDEPGALLLLLNAINPSHLVEYEAWHGTEHVPERLMLPGFRHADRYVFADDPCRFATIYWLDDAAALKTPEYLRLMAHPSPWSVRMRPVLRDVVRWAGLLRERRGSDDTPVLAVVSSPDGSESRISPPSADGISWTLAERIDMPAHPAFPVQPVAGDAPRWRTFIGIPENARSRDGMLDQATIYLTRIARIFPP